MPSRRLNRANQLKTSREDISNDLQEFHPRDRRRRHRARHLGHARPLDERLHRGGDGRARRRSSTRSPATPRSRARSSPPARTASPAAPTSPCCRRMLAAVARGEGARIRDKAAQDAVRRRRPHGAACSASWRPAASRGSSAINGTCMGGAFELSLACHGRVAADSDKVKMALPEVKVGIFPGAGGTQRVPRLADTQEALQMLTSGQTLTPQKAKAMGLIHEIAAPDEAGRDRQGDDQERPEAGRSPGTRRASSCPAARSIRRPAPISGRRRSPSCAARPTAIIRPPRRS